VTVSPQYKGTPAGTVTVKAGATAVCTITVKSAKGSCAIAASKLKTGTYQVTAIYNGNADYTGSTSSKKALMVAK
jgi:Bacterial Ig-like domain (group 3)